MISVRSTHAAYKAPKTLPSLMLWTWEAPQDLRSINVKTTGVALLILNISFKKSQIIYYLRQQPLYVPPNTYLTAVVHISNPPKNVYMSQTVAQFWAFKIKDVYLRGSYRELQIDFDAVPSQQPFYQELLMALRREQTTLDTVETHYNANYIIANAATIINTLPPSVLIQIAGMPKVPDNYRSVIYANLWVRSILFNNKSLEKKISQDAMKYNPVLTDTITQMTKSKNPDERKTLFLKALLYYPNLSPMINLKLYETWQGDDTSNMNSIVLRHESLGTSSNNWLWTSCDANCKTPTPAFLTPTQLIEYQAQLKLLTHLDGATRYISDSLIALANRYPHDLRYAKLLALFIQYTKYSSGGSKKAFIALKKLYPHSRWAKSTKYYY